MKLYLFHNFYNAIDTGVLKNQSGNAAKPAKTARAGSIALGLLISASLPLTCLSAQAQGIYGGSGSMPAAGVYPGGGGGGYMTGGSFPGTYSPPLDSLPSYGQATQPQSSVHPPAPSVQTRADSSTFKRPSKEFKYRKRFIAPSSDLYNRIDYPSMQSSRDSLMLPNYEPSWGKGQPNSMSTARPPVTYQPIHPDEPQEALKAKAQSLNDSKPVGGRPLANRAGLNPPPPANSKLLPNSLSHSTPTPISQNPLAGASAATPAALSAARIAQIKSQADVLVKKGELGQAQDLLKKVIQEHPHEPVLRAQLASISLDRARFYARQGNSQQAASQARLAISYGSAYSNASESAYSVLNSSLSKSGVDPKNPEARASLGATLLAQNNPQEAEIEFRQAIRLRPESEYYIGAGGAALQSGNKTSAKLDFQKALELSPDSQPALSKLGVVRYQLHDYVGANADLTRALVLNSQDTEAAQTLIDLWQHQISARPNDAGAHLGMARAYQVTGDLDNARKEYKTVVRIDPNHPNLPAARQSFKLALAKREACKSFEMAHSLETQGLLPQAFQKASDAVELYPSDSTYQGYKTQLAGQLQAAGLPVYAASGLALQALSSLMANGEQPPSASLPTAQALGLTGAMQPQGSMQMSPQMPAQSPAQMPATSTLGGYMPVDNMYKPLSTDAHVTSMTAFLASLRNFQMQQKAAQSGSSGGGGLSSLGGASAAGADAGDASSLVGLAGVPGFAPSNPLPGSGLPTSLDSGQLIAQGAQAQAALASGTIGGIGSSAGLGASSAASASKVTPQSALAAAAQALANTAGLNLGGGGGATSLATGAAGESSASAASGQVGGLMGAAMTGGASNGFMSGLTAGLGGGSTAGGAMGSSLAGPAAATGGAMAQTAAPAAAATAANLGVSNQMAAMALGLAPSAAPSMAQAMVGGLNQAASYLHKNSRASATGNLATPMTYGLTPNGNFATNQTMPTTVTQRVIDMSGGNFATAQSMAPVQEPANVNWPQPQPLSNASAPYGQPINQAIAGAPYATASSIASGAPMAAVPISADPTGPATAAALAPPIAQAIPANLASLPAGVTPQMAAAYLSGQGGAVPGAAPGLIAPGALKLYLTGVKASKSDVELQVSLRNDSPVPLKIPGGIKAVVRSYGQPDKQGKISFSSKVVNSGSSIAGTIKVPGKSLDPTADVVIPTANLTKGAIADIHLSVPISSK